jgi:hypothetical protein
MGIEDSATLGTSSPLEDFLSRYAEVTGGVWDEVEPQVYDLMLPVSQSGWDPEIVRVAFDPEAVPEHPGAQLASFGTPLVDRLLADAVSRGRHVELFMVGLNLAPQGLASRIRRTISLPDGFDIQIERERVLHFPQALFWFEATYLSDQKEQEILTVGIDLHHSRQVRHLDELVDRARLADVPWTLLPEAPHSGLAVAYPIARDRVIRTLSSLANSRSRELGERLSRQLERMGKYYRDLRKEVEEQAEKARNRAEDLSKFTSRRQALDREEQLRTTELRQKSQLKVDLRLINLLLIYQPKILLRTNVTSAGSLVGRLQWVWDPLIDALEATPCASCRNPTFQFAVNRQKQLVCTACANGLISGAAQPTSRVTR